MKTSRYTGLIRDEPGQLCPKENFDISVAVQECSRFRSRMPPFDPGLPRSGTVDLRCRAGEFPGPPDVTQVVPRYQPVTPRSCPGPAGPTRQNPGRAPVKPRCHPVSLGCNRIVYINRDKHISASVFYRLSKKNHLSYKL